MIVNEGLITEHNRIMIERRKNFYLLRKILRNDYIWTEADFFIVLTKCVKLLWKFIARDSLASYLSEIIYHWAGRRGNLC